MFESLDFVDMNVWVIYLNKEFCEVGMRNKWNMDLKEEEGNYIY